MKEAIMKIIERNNEVVKAIRSKNNVEISVQAMFALMEVNHLFTCEAYEIVSMARDLGIDAKCDMQTGEIIVYGDIQ